MRDRPTPEQAQEALREHVVRRAIEARERHPALAEPLALERLLEDRSTVRYPLRVVHDARPLGPGEFACLESAGERPSDGFVLFVHPFLEGRPGMLPLVVAYYLPSVNYGDVATHVEAELFGSSLLGLDRESYYETLCELSDALGGGGSGGGNGGGCGSGCGCGS